MKKYRFYILLTTLIIATLAFSNQSSVHAQSIKEYNDEIRDLEKKQSTLKGKQSEINEDKSSVDNKMGENLNSQESVKKQIKEIDAKLATTRADIESKENEITATNKEITELESNIEQLKEEIAELEERIKRREELLKDRLRSIQESGGNVPYISVILGSQNFNDLISRSSAVNSIMDQDKSIMEEHAADQLALRNKQKEVEQKRDALETKKAEQLNQKAKLDSLQAQLDQQMVEKEKAQELLKEEYEELEEYSFSLAEENKLISEQASALEKAKELAQSEKSRLEQEERDRLAQAEANTSSGGSSSSSSSATPPVVSGGSGSFIWPTSGSVTSPFRPAHRPTHNGIDIGAGKGTPVVASSTGVVSSIVTGCTVGNMSCGGGYGNHVRVVHHIDGKTFTTVYAHLSSVSVSAGQTVSQGQHLGGVGNTGHSYGNHLHFEIHPGGYKNPANPMSYLR